MRQNSYGRPSPNFPNLGDFNTEILTTRDKRDEFLLRDDLGFSVM